MKSTTITTVTKFIVLCLFFSLYIAFSTIITQAAYEESAGNPTGQNSGGSTSGTTNKGSTDGTKNDTTSGGSTSGGSTSGGSTIETTNKGSTDGTKNTGSVVDDDDNGSSGSSGGSNGPSAQDLRNEAIRKATEEVEVGIATQEEARLAAQEGVTAPATSFFGSMIEKASNLWEKAKSMVGLGSKEETGTVTDFGSISNSAPTTDSAVIVNNTNSLDDWKNKVVDANNPANQALPNSNAGVSGTYVTETKEVPLPDVTAPRVTIRDGNGNIVAEGRLGDDFDVAAGSTDLKAYIDCTGGGCDGFISTGDAKTNLTGTVRTDNEVIIDIGNGTSINKTVEAGGSMNAIGSNITVGGELVGLSSEEVVRRNTYVATNVETTFVAANNYSGSGNNNDFAPVSNAAQQMLEQDANAADPFGQASQQQIQDYLDQTAINDRWTQNDPGSPANETSGGTNAGTQYTDTSSIGGITDASGFNDPGITNPSTGNTAAQNTQTTEETKGFLGWYNDTYTAAKETVSSWFGGGSETTVDPNQYAITQDYVDQGYSNNTPSAFINSVANNMDTYISDQTTDAERRMIAEQLLSTNAGNTADRTLMAERLIEANTQQTTADAQLITEAYTQRNAELIARSNEAAQNYQPQDTRVSGTGLDDLLVDPNADFRQSLTYTEQVERVGGLDGLIEPLRMFLNDPNADTESNAYIIAQEQYDELIAARESILSISDQAYAEIPAYYSETQRQTALDNLGVTSAQYTENVAQYNDIVNAAKASVKEGYVAASLSLGGGTVGITGNNFSENQIVDAGARLLERVTDANGKIDENALLAELGNNPELLAQLQTRNKIIEINGEQYRVTEYIIGDKALVGSRYLAEGIARLTGQSIPDVAQAEAIRSVSTGGFIKEQMGYGDPVGSDVPIDQLTPVDCVTNCDELTAGTARKMIAVIGTDANGDPIYGIVGGGDGANPIQPASTGGHDALYGDYSQGIVLLEKVNDGSIAQAGGVDINSMSLEEARAYVSNQASNMGGAVESNLNQLVRESGDIMVYDQGLVNQNPDSRPPSKLNVAIDKAVTFVDNLFGTNLSGTPQGTNASLVEFIKNQEGFFENAYSDYGQISIGYGTRAKPGETTITEEEAVARLEEEVALAAAVVDENVTVPLTENQRNALISFVYNVGGGAFENSTLLRKLNTGDYASVDDEMARWIHADGQVLDGLVNRRADEASLFNTPDEAGTARLASADSSSNPFSTITNSIRNVFNLDNSVGNQEVLQDTVAKKWEVDSAIAQAEAEVAAAKASLEGNQVAIDSQRMFVYADSLSKLNELKALRTSMDELDPTDTAAIQAATDKLLTVADEVRVVADFAANNGATIQGQQVFLDAGSESAFEILPPINANGAMNPLLYSTDGASYLTKDYADEHMAQILGGPYQELVETLGWAPRINDAIAKAGTSRETETTGSQHFHGNALDIDISGLTDDEKWELVEAAKAAGFRGFGFGNGILHIDYRENPATWDYGVSTFAGRSLSDAQAFVTTNVPERTALADHTALGGAHDTSASGIVVNTVDKLISDLVAQEVTPRGTTGETSSGSTGTTGGGTTSSGSGLLTFVQNLFSGSGSTGGSGSGGVTTGGSDSSGGSGTITTGTTTLQGWDNSVSDLANRVDALQDAYGGEGNEAAYYPTLNSVNVQAATNESNVVDIPNQNSTSDYYQLVTNGFDVTSLDPGTGLPTNMSQETVVYVFDVNNSSAFDAQNTSGGTTDTTQLQSTDTTKLISPIIGSTAVNPMYIAEQLNNTEQANQIITNSRDTQVIEAKMNQFTNSDIAFATYRIDRVGTPSLADDMLIYDVVVQDGVKGGGSIKVMIPAIVDAEAAKNAFAEAGFVGDQYQLMNQAQYLGEVEPAEPEGVFIRFWNGVRNMFGSTEDVGPAVTYTDSLV